LFGWGVSGVVFLLPLQLAGVSHQDR